MTREEQDMIQDVEYGLKDILVAGLRQGHAENDWMDQSIESHSLRAMGHLIESEKMRQGHKPEDGEGVEGHLLRALCRTAMALYLERKCAAPLKQKQQCYDSRQVTFAIPALEK